MATITTNHGVYKAEHWAKPIPSRTHDWTWYNDDLYDGEGGEHAGNAATLDGVIKEICEYENDQGWREKRTIKEIHLFESNVLDLLAKMPLRLDGEGIRPCEAWEADGTGDRIAQALKTLLIRQSPDDGGE